MGRKTEAILSEYVGRKTLDKRTQKAELMLGNEEFLNEFGKATAYFGETFFKIKSLPESALKRITKSNPLAQYDHPDDEETLRLLGYSVARAGGGVREKVARNKLLMEAHRLMWREFCEKWNIHSKWDGKPRTFANHIHGAMRIGIIERPLIGQKEIFISLDAWATQKEMRERWAEIEELQSRIWTGKVEDKANFARDMCWYNLKTKAGMKVTGIARLWLERFPDEVGRLVVRRTIQRYPREIEKISKGKVLDDVILLREIESAQKPTAILSKEWEEFVRLFQTEHKEYLRRESPTADDKTFTKPSPFEDVIAKAIWRMQTEFKRPLRFPTEKSPFKITYLN